MPILPEKRIPPRNTCVQCGGNLRSGSGWHCWICLLVMKLYPVDRRN